MGKWAAAHWEESREDAKAAKKEAESEACFLRELRRFARPFSSCPFKKWATTAQWVAKPPPITRAYLPALDTRRAALYHIAHG